MGADPVSAADPIEPMDYLKAAAAGSLDAQRAIVMEACRRSESGEGDAYFTMIEGLVFARLAATHGNAGDMGRVISMLAVCSLLCELEGETDAAMNHQAEALARVAVAADLGVNLADDFLDRIIAESPPIVVQAAQELRRVIAGGTDK